MGFIDSFEETQNNVQFYEPLSILVAQERFLLSRGQQLG